MFSGAFGKKTRISSLLTTKSGEEPLSPKYTANADVKIIGAKLNEISDKARTGGEYEEIGGLYGFRLLVKTEVLEKEGDDIKINRFFIQGESNFKYTFNNGYMAADPKLAV